MTYFRLIKIDGVKFINEDYKKVMRYLLINKGYLVIPAASLLAEFSKKKSWRFLQRATIAIFDSGLLTLLIKIFINFSTKKFSGYKFLGDLIKDKSIQNKRVFSLDPNKVESKANNQFLKKNFKFVKNYLCPIYKKKSFYDPKLKKEIKNFKPQIIIINISGGVQEPLAYYLKNEINYKGIIICSGAAISFYTGHQAPISRLIDKMYLGWLIRILYKPKLLMRILLSLKLFYYFFNYQIRVYNKF
jgi:UDP-N-acetyl-D-mannosaminuronic acid transferase (WecB/TagA/CpsF family)